MLPTGNSQCGFYGALGDLADAAWGETFTAIQTVTGMDAEAICRFLDSPHGQYMGEDLRNSLAEGSSLQQAVRATVARWMNWRTGRVIQRELEIPAGLPYLTGLVGYYDTLRKRETGVLLPGKGARAFRE